MRITNVHSSYEDIHEGFGKVYSRMYGIDRQRFEELRAEHEHNVEILYMEGTKIMVGTKTQNLRKILIFFRIPLFEL
jgi:hypothetical protein